MDSNTYLQRPDWLTDELIKDLKDQLDDCPNPYTAEEARNIPLDGDMDLKRYNAYTAKKILAKYGFM